MDQELLRDIEADRQKERLKQLWHTYKIFIISGLALLFGGVGAHYAYDYHTQTKVINASVDFRDALEAIEANRHDEAQKLLTNISAQNTPYRALALFQQAALYKKANKTALEVAAYQQIIDTSSIPDVFRDYAHIRQGLALANKELPETVRIRLEKIANSSSVWQFSARELLAIDALHRDDNETARGHLTNLRDNRQAPSSLQERAGKVLETLTQ